MAYGAFMACSRALAGIAIALSACAAPPARPDVRAAIEGQVVDAATSRPIAGAVVIATWRTEVPPTPGALATGIAVGGHGNAVRRTAYIAEAVTNVNGRFAIPAWSAREQWTPGALTAASPTIRFVAPGYAPAASTRPSWGAGHGSELEPGLRGPGLMALFRPGEAPRENLGRDVSGLRPQTPQERQLEELRKLEASLDSYAAESDVARERARGAQREARQVVEEELRKANKEHTP